MIVSKKMRDLISNHKKRKKRCYFYVEELQVKNIGDTLPNVVYINKDGSKAYVLDKKVNGNIIFTTYEVNASKYKVINTQKYITNKKYFSWHQNFKHD